MFIFSIVCFLLQCGLWIYFNIKLCFTEAATRGALINFTKGALINFTKSTGKHMRQSLFLNKVTGLRAATLLKQKFWHIFFSCEFCEISKNTLFTEHLWTTASDLICGVFFIFSIIKNFRHEKSRFVRKRSTSGKPAFS